MALSGYSVPQTVTDDGGNALKAVTVTVTGPGGYSGTATTNASTGVLRLGPLPVGDYTVSYQGRSVTVPVEPVAADVQSAFDLASAAETPAGAQAKATAAQTAATTAAAADATTKANAAQAAAVQRANHTGTQLAATISDFNTAAVSAGSGTYLSGKTGLYLPSDWGQFWKPALRAAKAGTGLARVAIVGDSVSFGQFASDLTSTSWAGSLTSALQSVGGNGGSGLVSTMRTTLMIGGSYAPAGLVTLAGTWAAFPGTNDGPGAVCVAGQAAGSTATFTVTGDTIDVFMLQLTSGGASYQVTIDGGAATAAVSTNGASKGIIQRTFTGQGSGTHTVVVSTPDAVSGTSAIYLCGVSGRNASGVVVDNYSRSGFVSTMWNNQTGTSFVAGSGTTYGGANNGTFGKAGQWCGGSKRPADLVIYSLGLNDAHIASPIAPDTFIRNVRLYLDDVKGGGSQVGATDVIFLCNHGGAATGEGSGGAAFEDTATTYYANYIARLRTLAESYGAAWVNVWASGRNSWNYWNSINYWGNAAISTGAAGTDTVHPSNAGHAAMQSLLSFVTATS